MAEIWHPQDIQVYRDWINCIIEEASDKLTNWESSFIAQMDMKVTNGSNLMQGQAEKVEQIYVQYTK